MQAVPEAKRMQLMQFLIACALLAVASTTCSTRVSFEIQTTWDSLPVNHTPVRLVIYQEKNGSIPVNVYAPFFNDSPVPTGPAGQPFFRLWDYEVVELFLLGNNDRYLEIELSPYGQHLVLLLDGENKAIKHSLPLKYRAIIDGDTWHGEALVPVSYLPPVPSRMNAYAIHGSGEARTYEALFPVPHRAYVKPDFHRLQYFSHVMMEPLFKTDVSNVTEVWQKALEAYKQGQQGDATA
ncbi:UPF0462 protein C4orf33 homolog [Ornithodoros turicata]